MGVCGSAARVSFADRRKRKDSAASFGQLRTTAWRERPRARSQLPATELAQVREAEGEGFT